MSGRTLHVKAFIATSSVKLFCSLQLNPLVLKAKRSILFSLVVLEFEKVGKHVAAEEIYLEFIHKNNCLRNSSNTHQNAESRLAWGFE